MTQKMRISLSTKFLPPILVIVLLSTTVGAFIMFNDVQDSTLESIDKAKKSLIIEQRSAEQAQITGLKSKSDVVGNFMANTAPDFILAYDYSSLIVFQEEAEKDPDVAFAAFLDTNGKPITQFKKPDDMSTVIEKKYPIIVEDENYGYVLIGMSKALLLKSVKESNQRIDTAITDISVQGEQALAQFKKIGMIIIAVLVVSITISLILMFRVFVITPLQRLKDSASAFSKGKLEQDIDTRSTDELGSLALSFSDMRDSIKKKIDDLSILNITGDVLAGTRSQAKALETAVNILHEHMNVVSGSVYLFDEETQTLNLSCFYPQRGDLHKHAPRSFQLGEGVAGQAAEKKKVIHVANIDEDETYIAGHLDTSRCIIAVPMLDDDKLFGVMNLSGTVGEVLFDQSIQDFAENISRMTVVTVKNIQMLEVIEEQNRTLEHKVEERTAELAQKTNDINNMLQNMHQGIFTITQDANVHPEYSAYLELILEHKEIADRGIMQLLFKQTNLGSNSLDQIKTALSAILGEDAMMFDFNKHCLVPEFTMIMSDGREKILELDWDPMIDAKDVIEKLMVTVRDVTDLRGLQAEADKQKGELEIIGQILAISEGKFQEFIKTGFEFIDENKILIEDATDFNSQTIEVLFRNMHTIKGNARTYGFSGITDTVHETEQTYDDLRKANDPAWNKTLLLDELGSVEELISGYNTVYEEKLKSANSNGIFMDEQLINIIHRTLADVDTANLEHASQAIKKLRALIDAIGSETIDSIIENIVSSLPSMAENLGKKAPNIVIKSNNIRLVSDIVPVMRNVLTHAFRNSVDHGLESADERSGLGKTAEGTITLIMQQTPKGIMLKMFDDGRGLALEKIKQKAIDSRIISANDDVTDDQLASLIFHSGLSTADQVNNVSGRGVGMDAVKRFMVSIGGDIAIHLIDKTNEGKGFRHFDLCISIPDKYAKEVA